MLLEVAHLRIEYRTVGATNRAINDLTFTVDRGEVVGLVGESGSGKSTAALAVLGLVRHSGAICEGSVRLDGTELLNLTVREWNAIRGTQIALVTQNPRAALNPVMRVGEQIATVYRSHVDTNAKAARAHARELLRVVGINDPDRRLDAFPHELSGGMAQRVLIAMALSCSPKLLIADEPTSGLDVTVQAQILDDLSHAVSEVGSSLLLVTQDLGIVANYCDRIYLLHAGEVAETATTEGFFAQPAHPCGIALFNAQRDQVDESLRLQGFPVDGRRLPDGCYLQKRCPFANPESGCMSIHPELGQIAPGHASRCHRTESVLEAVRRKSVTVA